MQPDIADCKEYEYEEMNLQEKQHEIEVLSRVQSQMKEIAEIQQHLDLNVVNQDEGLDLVENNVSQVKETTQTSKILVEQAMDSTLSLRTNKLTLAFSGIVGALSMVKGFGVTIGGAVGGFLGRKIGKAAEGGIREKIKD